MKHLRYGGSTIARTINCSAWRKLADTLPPTDSNSDFAREGTLLHNCMEEFYDKDVSCADMLDQGREYEGIQLTQDHLDDKLYPAIEAVEAIFDKYDVEEFDCEPFVELLPGVAGGSIDMLAISGDKKTAIVIDYKFGYNSVDATENAQMLFYALCSESDPKTTELMQDTTDLVLAIIQPNDQGDVADVWTTEASVLDDFEDTVLEAIQAAKVADISTPESRKELLRAGSWCAYCPAEAVCDIKLGVVATAQRLDLDQVKNLSAAMALVDQMESWAKAVKKMAHEQLEQGVSVEGYKLVNKRATRVWNDPEAVEKKIKAMKGLAIAEAQDSKLKSPTQMEKVFKQKDKKFSLTEYISAVSSGTTMAKESDKRPAILPTLALKALADRL